MRRDPSLEVEWIAVSSTRAVSIVVRLRSALLQGCQESRSSIEQVSVPKSARKSRITLVYSRDRVHSKLLDMPQNSYLIQPASVFSTANLTDPSSPAAQHEMLDDEQQSGILFQRVCHHTEAVPSEMLRFQHTCSWSVQQQLVSRVGWDCSFLSSFQVFSEELTADHTSCTSHTPHVG